MFTGTNSIDFFNYFTNHEICLEYIAKIKWPDNNFTCRKCGHNNFCKGKKAYNRRCTKCKYDESPTTKTMFERIDFDLVKAFHFLYRLSVKKKGMSSYELSNELSLTQKTCWKFRNKVQFAMKSSENFPLEGNVDVDEFLVGGPEKGKQGRSHGKKKLVIIALERTKSGGFGRSYSRMIERSTTKEFRPFFESHISKNANIRADKWVAYTPLTDYYSNLEQIDSDNGLNFRELHIQIMNFKGWLRGIHHHCSKEFMQGYLDEYNFRFNRRNHLNTIFHKLVERMTLIYRDKDSATKVT